jgi:hypothetical protein
VLLPAASSCSECVGARPCEWLSNSSTAYSVDKSDSSSSHHPRLVFKLPYTPLGPWVQLP